MELNIILAVGCTVAVIVTTIILYIYNARKEEVSVRKEFKNIWDVVEGVKQMMVDLVREDISIDATDEEFNRLYKRKAMLSSALKQSAYGMDGAKQVIKDQIMQFIQDNMLPQEVDIILGMDGTNYPSDHIIFETIMQHYKVRYGKNAFVEWMVKHNLQKAHEANGRKRYYIDVRDLHDTYEQEDIKMTESDKQQLLATLVYQLYRGFGILDTVREMNIDGVNIGTSGSVLSSIDGCGDTNSKLSPAEESVRGCWVYYHGTYIHLRFMNFGSENEMKRIITMIIRYNNGGSLTAKRGYIVSTMYDKSRVLAVRPPCSEWWACFIRKFSLKNVTVHSLIDKEYVKNGNVACDLIRYLMLGQTTSLVTGRQGSGKTTLLSAMMAYIDNRFNVRVLELAPELYLRELYPDRNILSVQETNTVSAAELQDCLKKSDAAVSIAGEIATDAVAARFIQFCMTASIFCVGTHHANTTRDLVLTLRNSLVNDGGFSNMETAEKQVTECIRCDIHMDYTPDGKRFVHRISEVVPIDRVPYVSFDEEVPERKNFSSDSEFEAAMATYKMKLEKFKIDLDKDYYQRVTDREGFVINQLMHYDLKTDMYITDNKPSDALYEKMLSVMDEKDRQEFERFILENWEAEKIMREGEIEDIELGGIEDDFGNMDGGMIQEEEDDGAFAFNTPSRNVESYKHEEQSIDDAEDFSAAMEVMREKERNLKTADLADVDEYGEFLNDDSVSEAADEAARKSMADLYAPVKRTVETNNSSNNEDTGLGEDLLGGEIDFDGDGELEDIEDGFGEDAADEDNSGGGITGLWG